MSSVEPANAPPPPPGQVPDFYYPNTQITKSLFDGLIDLMSDYEVWDIMDVVDALHLGENKVWVNCKLKTVREVLDGIQNKMLPAKEVMPIAWSGGPHINSGGTPKGRLMRGSLMHYVVDVILRQTITSGTKAPVVEAAACHLSME